MTGPNRRDDRGAGRGAPTLPTDRQVDRRDFLQRLGAAIAAASGGSLAGVWAAPAAARTPGGEGMAALSRQVAERRPTGQETDPADFTLLDAAARIRSGDLGPVELVEACLARIRTLDGVFLAFNAVEAESARAAAVSAQEQRGGAAAAVAGPLHGVPLALKDNFFTAGVPTTANSLIFEDFVPEWDAEAWSRLRAAGAILVGKTQMGPLATSRATTPQGESTTRNAWAPDHPGISPGGSSSGSATAVALGMAPCATGTQTGGSITNPAEAQGLTGLKPTMGRVSLRGIIPLTYTRDHPGPIARDAQDAALMLQLMGGPDPADPRTLGQPPLPDLLAAAAPVRDALGRTRLRWPTRVGVVPGYLDGPGEPPDPPGPDASEEERREYEYVREDWERDQAGIDARRRMLETFRELGAEIVEVPWPDDWDTLSGRHFNNARLPERTEPFLEHLRDDVRKFGVSLSPWIQGLLLPATEYVRGQRGRLLLLRRTLDQVFSRCDVVVQTRPVPFDILGLPLITFPVGTRRTDAGELPVGALLGGMPWAEDRLLSLAGAYQAVTEWHLRRPPSARTPAAGAVPGAGAPPGRSAPGAGGRDDHRLDSVDVWLRGE